MKLLKEIFKQAMEFEDVVKRIANVISVDKNVMSRLAHTVYKNKEIKIMLSDRQKELDFEVFLTFKDSKLPNVDFGIGGLSLEEVTSPFWLLFYIMFVYQKHGATLNNRENLATLMKNGRFNYYEECLKES
jgi:hypothetical protein